MSTVWRNYRTLGPARRRAVVAVPLVGLAYAVTGSTGTLVIAIVIAAALLLLLHQPRVPAWEPSPEQLRAIDAHRAAEDADAFAATGAGDAAYEEALRTLQALVGHDVTVYFGAGGAAWVPLGILSGTLRYAIDAPDDGTERLFFAVGNSGSGFYVDADQIKQSSTTVVHPRRGRLEIYTDTGVLLIHEWAADRSA